MFNQTNTIIKIVVVSRMISTNRTIKFDFRVKIKQKITIIKGFIPSRLLKERNLNYLENFTNILNRIPFKLDLWKIKL